MIKNLLKAGTKRSLVLNRFAKIHLSKQKKNWITFHQYDRQHEQIKDKILDEINTILNYTDDNEFWLYEREFEKLFAKKYGCKFAVGTCSGTSALQLSLAALGIGKGDEVITASNTYIATALAISNTGAKPVFVDINEEDYNIDASKIEEAITNKTKAIMPVHLYGQSVDMKPIMKIAKQYNLKIVEDACQAYGATYNGKKVGTFGDTGCFSLFTGKNLGGLGNGGIIVSNNKTIINELERLRDPESNSENLLFSRRTPCYLDAIQAAFLKPKLKVIDGWIGLIREKANLYDKYLADTSLILPKENKNCKHTYYSYVVRLKQRDKLKQYLKKHKVETSIEYEVPLHLTKTFEYLGYKKGVFPIAEKCAKEILSLPISPFLSEEEITKVSLLIKKFDSKQK